MSRAVQEPLESRSLLSIDMIAGMGGGCSGAAETGAVATDLTGNIYVAGKFTGTIDVDPSRKQFIISSTTGGAGDLFVVKFSPDRRLIWARTIGGMASTVAANDLAVDAYGVIYVAGEFNGTVDFCPTAATVNVTSKSGSVDGFLLQLSPAGKFGWVQPLAGRLYDSARAVALDSDGFIYVGGTHKESMDYGDNATKLSLGKRDGFVIKYAADRTPLAAPHFGGAGDDSVEDICVYGPDVSIVGNMQGRTQISYTQDDIDPQHLERVILNGLGGTDAFYATLKKQDLYTTFAQRYGGNGNDFGEAVSNGPGGAFITGTFDHPINTGGGATIAPVGGSDIFVKKIFGQMKTIGTTANDSAGGVVQDPNSGQLVVAGIHGAPIAFQTTFGRIAPYFNGEDDGFLLAYDSSFDQITYAAEIGGRYIDRIHSLSAGFGDRFVVGGSFQVSSDLGPWVISAQVWGSRDSDWFALSFIVSDNPPLPAPQT